MDQLVVGTFSPSVLLELAECTGRLAATSLQVREVAVASSPAQFRDLRDGVLDLALTSPDNVLSYRFNPSNPLGGLLDVSIVSAVDRGLGLGLYAAPGRRVEDLRGARIGVDVPTSGFALALYALGEELDLPRESYTTVELGATPRRLEALLDGRCDATMLNAGSELHAEAAGCVRLSGIREQLTPYLGTVLAEYGGTRLDVARRLADALRETAIGVVQGELDEPATQIAGRRLGMRRELAVRYVAGLRDRDDGLVTASDVDRDALATLVRLRTRYLPAVYDGTDVLAGALEPGSGLLGRA